MINKIFKGRLIALSLIICQLSFSVALVSCESELDIEILSPWYRSWWAWILYALLIGLLFYGRKRITRLFQSLFKRSHKQEKMENEQPVVSEEEEIEEAVMIDE